MKITLILPDGHIHSLRVGGWIRSMREAPLTITTLAALAPSDLDLEFQLIDESVEPLPESIQADLVGISVLTGTSKRAYALADRFRSQGVPVVLGGVHVTLMPDEAAGHADAIVVGPAESRWPQLLHDFVKGHLQAHYETDPTRPYAQLPIAKRLLQRRGRYNAPQVVMATRGCRHACDFCTVPVTFPGYQRRPVAEVIDEIRMLPGKLFVFNDVSLVDDVDYSMELFEALTPLKKKWGGLATVQLARESALLDQMARSGCRYLLTGFESINQDALLEIKKGFNREKQYAHFMEQMHGHGISIQGCFIFGFDHDTLETFESTVDFVQRHKIDIPRYALLTPYPGTPLFKRLMAEGRMLSLDWSDFDTMHVVFRPAQMTPEQLYTGFKHAYRQTFRLKNIAQRCNSPSLTGIINLVGNLTYRFFVRRLDREARFSQPHHGNMESTQTTISLALRKERPCRA